MNDYKLEDAFRGPKKVIMEDGKMFHMTLDGAVYSPVGEPIVLVGVDGSIIVWSKVVAVITPKSGDNV